MTEMIIGGLLTTGGTLLAGLMAYVTTRNKNRTDRTTLLEQRVESVEGKFRVLEDYTGDLRGNLRDAGLPVPPWPPELRD